MRHPAAKLRHLATAALALAIALAGLLLGGALIGLCYLLAE